MTHRHQNPRWGLAGVLAYLALAAGGITAAAPPAQPDERLLRDRVAIERVYHAHRIAATEPFEEAMPQALVKKLVAAEQHKEEVLAKVYGVAISAEMLAAEVRRIDTTTRAPEILAEIRHALGDDEGRFARSFAKPFLVERELHSRFQFEDRLHAPLRAKAEALRDALLKAESVEARTRLLEERGPATGDLQTITWLLGPRPEEESAEEGLELEDLPPGIGPLGPGAKILSTPRGADAGEPGEEPKHYFEDLHPELQKVLSVQLTEAGAVSAVIEMPSGFLLYLAQERTAEDLTAQTLSLPKVSYDEWLSKQPE